MIMGKKIATIGGGNGQSSLLRHLKDYDHEISAVVTMMDSGGSSGRLREERGLLPPGDIRRCIASMAIADKDVDKRWNDRDENGDAIGNLEIAQKVEELGSYGRAVDFFCSELGVSNNGKKIQVLPVTEQLTHLVAKLENGDVVRGEHNIDVPQHDEAHHIVDIWCDPPVSATERVKQALRDADLVVFTMGDLYTSVLVNCLAEGVTEAIVAGGAKVVYLCDRSTKPGETHNYTVKDFYNEISRYIKPAKIDYIIMDPSEPLLEGGQQLVIYEDIDADVEIIKADIACEQKPHLVSGTKAAREIDKLCRSI